MPDDNQTMFRREKVNSIWHNWHETVTGPIARVDVISRPPDDLSYSASAVKRCVEQIRRAMRDARQEGIECRAVGRCWSLSDAPKTTGAMIDIAQLNCMKRVHHMQIHPEYKGGDTHRRGLCLVQAGTYVSELNRWLEAPEQKLSIRTTGAANGQTIAGATQAGTHGSVLESGAMHDHVVGIHLLAGPDRSVWLERARYPVLRDSVAEAFGAEMWRDDDLFDAVVVGLGGFGVIVQLVIEARPRFMLQALNTREDSTHTRFTLDAAMRKRIGKLDFTSNPELDPPGGNGKPYFFQPIVNPNTNPPQVLMTHMYEREWDPTHPIDYTLPEDTFGPGYDFVTVAGRVLDAAQFLVPLFSHVVEQSMFSLEPKFGTWGELFGYKTERTKVASGTVAVSLDKGLDALDALIELNHEIGPVPLVFGCRYVKKSPALLAFNRWETTFVVSIDGIWNPDSLDFFKAIPAKMDAKGIPFTQHWGKSNAYDATRVRTAYGNANVDKWIAARNQLLPDPADRALFSNAMLRRCGLA